jgi:lipopolysaccharide transport system ATP-binding protein
MSNIVISVEHLSKAYRLGQIGTGTLSHDLNVWWANVRGKPHPWQKIGEADYNNRIGETIWALEDINFTVEQGEVLGIIGRNGAGKSTLLKILSRVTAPTSGKALVRGRIASLLEIGTGFHPDLTGRENTYLNGAILGMSRKEIEGKFEAIVDFSGVEKFIDTPVKHYSSGMYVRLAFAVAAHLEPEILIVDEVLAVGDAEFQKKCLGKMGDVAYEGRAVLFVSHNMGAIEFLCKRCILLDNGQIVKSSDDVHSIIRQYIGSGLISKGSEYDWTKIENEYFRLLNFKLLKKSNHQETNVFSRGDDIEIEISLSNFIINPNFGIGYALFDLEQNICLWWSFNIDVEQIVLKTGDYIFRTTIPKGTLNARSYRVELIASLYDQGWIISPGQKIGLEFKVEAGAIGSLNFSTTKRDAFLMPLFPWENEFVPKKS